MRWHRSPLDGDGVYLPWPQKECGVYASTFSQNSQEEMPLTLEYFNVTIG
jgi:hypothetical protein